MYINTIIKQIENKDINPTKIYKGSINNSYTIEIETINPISFISIIYNTETKRNKAFLILDDIIFWKLSFNPNK
jgi:hypothetical protein